MTKRRRSYRRRRKSRLPKGPVFIGSSLLIVLGVLYFARSHEQSTAKAKTEDIPLSSRLLESSSEEPNQSVVTQAAAALDQPELPTPLAALPQRPNVQGFASKLQQRLSEVEKGQAQVIPLRNEWLTWLEQPLNAEQQQELKDALGQLSRRWLWGPKVLGADTLCTTYTVQPGDQLATIARKYQTPWELLAQINGINNPRGLKAWQKLKVVQGPFHAVVHKSSFTLDLYLQKTFVRSYRIALARPGKVTPTGLWVIQDRMRAAPWTDPETGKTYQPSDPEYPLGPVWIPLKGISGDAQGQPSYGIHGTNDPASIGTASSSGCIRLRNPEAEELYSLLLPGVSYVRVID